MFNKRQGTRQQQQQQQLPGRAQQQKQQAQPEPKQQKSSAPPPQTQPQPPPQQGAAASQASAREANVNQKFQAIKDNFTSVELVQQALRQYGLESCELMVAIDFTKSNEWQGQRSFGGRNLHDVSTGSSPYQDAVSSVARVLAAFSASSDAPGIPCCGFGDATTHAEHVFSFFEGDRPASGVDDLVQRYKALVPHVRLSGPTCLAPAVQQAMRVVKGSGNRYHVLLLMVDGPITRSIDTPSDELSDLEQASMDAIVAASVLPLSIVVVGVGDGPWDAMRAFDDRLPQRHFENFQFVDFHRVMAGLDPAAREAQFALRALLEVPQQYASVLQHGLTDPGAGANILVEYLPAPKDPPAEEAVLTSLTDVSYPAVAPPVAEGVDELFLCPITQDVMRDPVIAADGYTYDRSAIEGWFAGHDSSPMTGGAIASKALIANNVLRSRIMETYPHLAG